MSLRQVKSNLRKLDQHNRYSCVTTLGLEACVTWLAWKDSASMIDYCVCGFIRARGLSYL